MAPTRCGSKRPAAPGLFFSPHEVDRVQPADKARRDLLAAARRLLELAEGPPVGPLTVLVVCGRVALVSRDQPAPTPLPMSSPILPEGLPPLQHDILVVLSSEPVSTQRLANLANRRLNSKFREALAALVEAGLVRHTRKGYFRP